MVNQQLNDYITEQVRVGVSKEAIRGALLEAGWKEADVNEAMGMGSSAPKISAPVTVAKPITISQPAQPSQPAALRSMDAILPAARPAAVMGKPAMPSSFPEIRPKMEPMIQPVVSAKPAAPAKPVMPVMSFAKQTMPAKPTAPASGMQYAAPVSQPAMVQPVKPQPARNMTQPVVNMKEAMVQPVHSKHRIVDIVMGLLVLVLGAAATVFFLKSSSLVTQVDSLSGDQGAIAGEVATLKTENTTLKASETALKAMNADLESQLGIFVSSRISGEEQIDIAGALMLGGNGATSTPTTPYVLKTSKGIMLTLKNSRTANVDAILKPLLNQVVTIHATHVVGGKDLTVLAVNGQAF